MRKLTLLLSMCLSMNASGQEEICAGTFQSFWQIEHSSKTLRLKAFYKHPKAEFCERSMTESSNAQVQLLDSSKNIIRQFATYLPINLFQDSQRNGKIVGSIFKPNSQIIQIKFADDEPFKKAKFINIIFVNGSTYGPASF